MRASEIPLPESFVPVPAVYLDAVMPTLSDPEWRVLCVVIRQTLGWTGEPGSSSRKGRDWITQSQFRQRTGKSRDAISLAISSLVRRGLIVVESREGAPLPSARSRQNNRDRLYFRLAAIPLQEAV